MFKLFVAEVLGFEPRLKDSKSFVLTITLHPTWCAFGWTRTTTSWVTAISPLPVYLSLHKGNINRVITDLARFADHCPAVRRSPLTWWEGIEPPRAVWMKDSKSTQLLVSVPRLELGPQRPKRRMLTLTPHREIHITFHWLAFGGYSFKFHLLLQSTRLGIPHLTASGSIFIGAYPMTHQERLQSKSNLSFRFLWP